MEEKKIKKQKYHSLKFSFMLSMCEKIFEHLHARIFSCIQRILTLLVKLLCKLQEENFLASYKKRISLQATRREFRLNKKFIKIKKSLCYVSN